MNLTKKMFLIKIQFLLIAQSVRKCQISNEAIFEFLGKQTLSLKVVFCFRITFILILTLASCESIRVTCVYKNIPWPVIGNAYTCQIRNLNVVLRNQTITNVAGNHLHRMTDQHVRAFDISGQTCHFLPERIKNFFPNIELLQVWRSSLKEISKKDLQPFPKLRVLHAHANEIESLENDLFAFNTELIRIDFRHQNLKVIGYKIFDNLNKLKLADFQSSGCVDFFSKGGSEEIEKLRTEIRVNCLPIDEFRSELIILKETIEALEAKTLAIEGKSKNLDDLDDPLVKKLEAKITQMIEENSKCSANLEIVTKNFLTFIERVDTIEKSLQNQTCPVHKVEGDLCLLEKEQLQRSKRDLNAIDLRCENVEWSSTKTCNVRNLQIVQPEVEIRKVLRGKQEIETLSLEEVKVFNEKIVFLPLKLGDLFKNLKFLSVVESGLVSISDQAFKSMTKLQKLMLSHNKLQEINGDPFKDLGALTSLDISFNKIYEISANAFVSLKNLTELKLNDNSLIQLPAEVFKSQTNMKFLFVQRNNLMYIFPKLLEPTKKLDLADFSNNSCVNLLASKTSIVTIKSLETFFAENCLTF